MQIRKDASRDTVQGQKQAVDYKKDSWNDGSPLTVGFNGDNLCDIIGQVLKIPPEICTMVFTCVLAKKDPATGKLIGCPLNDCKDAITSRGIAARGGPVYETIVVPGEQRENPDGTITYDEDEVKRVLVPQVNNSTRRTALARIDAIAQSCQIFCKMLGTVDASASKICGDLMKCTASAINVKPDGTNDKDACLATCAKDASTGNDNTATICQQGCAATQNACIGKVVHEVASIACGSVSPPHFTTVNGVEQLTGACVNAKLSSGAIAGNVAKTRIESECDDEKDTCINKCPKTKAQCDTNCRNAPTFDKACCSAIDLFPAGSGRDRAHLACNLFFNSKQCLSDLGALAGGGNCRVNLTPADDVGAFENFDAKKCIPPSECCNMFQGLRLFSKAPNAPVQRTPDGKPVGPSANIAADSLNTICRATIDVWQCASTFVQSGYVHMNEDCCNVMDLMREFRVFANQQDYILARKYCTAIVNVAGCRESFLKYKAERPSCEAACEAKTMDDLKKAKADGLLNARMGPGSTAGVLPANAAYRTCIDQDLPAAEEAVTEAAAKTGLSETDYLAGLMVAKATADAVAARCDAAALTLATKMADNCKQEDMKEYSASENRRSEMVKQAQFKYEDCLQRGLKTVQYVRGVKQDIVDTYSFLLQTMEATDPGYADTKASLDKARIDVQNAQNDVILKEDECKALESAVQRARSSARHLAKTLCSNELVNCKQQCKFGSNQATPPITPQCCAIVDVFPFLGQIADRDDMRKLCQGAIDTASCVRNIVYGDGTKKVTKDPNGNDITTLRVPAVDDRCCNGLAAIQSVQRCNGDRMDSQVARGIYPDRQSAVDGCNKANSNLTKAVNACHAAVDTTECVQEYLSIQSSNNRMSRRMSEKCCSAAVVFPEPDRTRIRALCMSAVSINNCWQQYNDDQYDNDTLGTTQPSLGPDGEADHIISSQCCEALGQWPNDPRMETLEAACRTVVDLKDCMFGPAGLFGRKGAIQACKLGKAVDGTPLTTRDVSKGGCPGGSAGDTSQYLGECVDICLKDLGRAATSGRNADFCREKCACKKSSVSTDANSPCFECEVTYKQVKKAVFNQDTLTDSCDPVPDDQQKTVTVECKKLALENDTTQFTGTSITFRDTTNATVSFKLPKVGEQFAKNGASCAEYEVIEVKNSSNTNPTERYENVCEYNCVMKHKFIPNSCCNAIGNMADVVRNANLANGKVPNPNNPNEGFGVDDLQTMKAWCTASVSAVKCMKNLLAKPYIITRECCGMTHLFTGLTERERDTINSACTTVVDSVACVKGMTTKDPATGESQISIPQQCCQAIDSGLMLVNLLTTTSDPNKPPRDNNADGVPNYVETREAARKYCYAAISTADCYNSLVKGLNQVKTCKESKREDCSKTNYEKLFPSSDTAVSKWPQLKDFVVANNALEPCSTFRTTKAAGDLTACVNKGGKKCDSDNPADEADAVCVQARAYFEELNSCKRTQADNHCPQIQQLISEQCCRAADVWTRAIQSTNRNQSNTQFSQALSVQEYCMAGISAVDCVATFIKEKRKDPKDGAKEVGPMSPRCCGTLNAISNSFPDKRKMQEQCGPMLQCANEMIQQVDLGKFKKTDANGNIPDEDLGKMFLPSPNCCGVLIDQFDDPAPTDPDMTAMRNKVSKQDMKTACSGAVRCVKDFIDNGQQPGFVPSPECCQAFSDMIGTKKDTGQDDAQPGGLLGALFGKDYVKSMLSYCVMATGCVRADNNWALTDDSPLTHAQQCCNLIQGVSKAVSSTALNTLFGNNTAFSQKALTFCKAPSRKRGGSKCPFGLVYTGKACEDKSDCVAGKCTGNGKECELGVCACPGGSGTKSGSGYTLPTEVNGVVRCL